MNIVICDDETRDIERLQRLLVSYDEEKQIGFSIQTYTSGEELLRELDRLEPDILFLDINMERMGGLALAAKIRERFEELPIILVTAYINYAIDGYKVRANRFLVKDDLEKTIGECLNDICAQIARKRRSLCFSCVEGEVRVLLAEILYVEVSGHKCVIQLKDQSYHIYESMENMEKSLREYGFLRVHQSYLVNPRHIRKINHYVLTLDSGTEIPVPKSRYKQVKKEYALFAGRELC